MEANEKTALEKIASLTKRDWQPLLDLIPRIEQEDKFGETIVQPGQFPYFAPGEVISRFWQIIHELPVMVPFDWPGWKEGHDLLRDPDIDYHDVDIPTKCKLITMLVRQERFSEGTLAWAFESGLMLKILKAIRDQVALLKN
jgi:hypothetical protein